MRFSYIKYDDRAAGLQETFKKWFEGMEAMTADLPDSRAKSLIFTKLEEAYMWVGKAVRDDQIERTGKFIEQRERGE